MNPGHGIDFSALKPLKVDPLFIIPLFSTQSEYEAQKAKATHPCSDCGKPIPNTKDFEKCFKCAHSEGGFKRQ